VDRGQIEQVLLNLYVNAWQAMPDGGELYLETANLTIDETCVKALQVKPGHYVKVSVTDTGVGMDEETKQRIFEPFFSTKEMGRGNGLGLASAYGIIRNHHGLITVYSEKNRGTTFNIYLPASEKEIVAEEIHPEKILRGKETILLVDDEDMVVEVGRPMLEFLGYQVLVARGGKQAVKVYEGNEMAVAIVLLDMIMPDLSGKETYERLRAINPDIKVLLVSGYSMNGQAIEMIRHGCKGFIQKPFTLSQISQRIRKALDQTD
jgi:CheY-like chemotaxis protein